MALRIVGAGLALSVLLLAGGCKSRSNYCPPAVVARPACPTPGCATPVAVASPGPAPCCNGTPGAVPPPPYAP
jgi:hypothetical protein